MWVQSLGREDLLEKEMATHSSILAWKSLRAEEAERLQCIGLESQTRLSDSTTTTLAISPKCPFQTHLLRCLPSQSSSHTELSCECPFLLHQPEKCLPSFNIQCKPLSLKPSWIHKSNSHSFVYPILCWHNVFKMFKRLFLTYTVNFLRLQSYSSRAPAI